MHPLMKSLQVLSPALANAGLFVRLALLVACSAAPPAVQQCFRDCLSCMHALHSPSTQLARLWHRLGPVLHKICMQPQPVPHLQAALPEGAQTHFRSIVTNEFLQVKGSGGSIFAIGDAATIEQVRVQISAVQHSMSMAASGVDSMQEQTCCMQRRTRWHQLLCFATCRWEAVQRPPS